MYVQIGEKYGRLTVIRRVENQISVSGKTQRKYLCRCDCGNEVEVVADCLRRGHTKSCGCLSKENLAKGSKIAHENIAVRAEKIVGKQFGAWRVISSAGTNKFGQLQSVCRCDECGEMEIRLNSCLISGHTTMCTRCNARKQMEKCQQAYEDDCVEGTNLSMLTQKLARNNKTGVKGVYFDKRRKKYVAQIQCKGISYRLGVFSNLDDAAKARRLAEEELFDSVHKKYERETTGEVEKRRAEKC